LVVTICYDGLVIERMKGPKLPNNKRKTHQQTNC